MSTAVKTAKHTATRARSSSEAPPADVLVVFGITGDLAKVMTFHSLYRLEQRGLLDCPIVGVAGDDWTVEHLREHARKCIEGMRRDDRRARLRALRRAAVVPQRRLHRRRHLRAPGHRARRREQPRLLPGDPALPVRAGDQTARRRRPHQERARGRGEALRPRPRLRARARRRNPPVHRGVPALPDRPLPRQDGHRRVPLPALRQHDDRADLEPQPHRLRADHDGRELRRGGPRALLRPRRRACATWSSTT